MLSYARGPEAPILEKTIYEAFADAARLFPDHEALVVSHEGLRLTYGELTERIEQTARGLAGLGLRPGDRVGIWASNCVEWILTQFGCARAGLVLVNVNPAYRSVDLAYVLRKSQMCAIVLREQDARANYRAILDEARAGQELPLQHAIYIAHESWNRMIDGGAGIAWDPPQPDDVANIQYTSGTTGSPKGVLLTHRNLVNNAWFTAEVLGSRQDDRMVVPLPLYHCAGCVCGVLATLERGATVILPSAQFDPGAALAAAARERATGLAGVPTMLVAMLEHPRFETFDLSSVRSVWTGGAPCPVKLMKRVMDRIGVDRVHILYGQTESSPIITMPRPDDSPELCIGSIGAPLMNTEVKIVSPITLETLPVGGQGELCTRGYHVMKGYDGEPEATARAIDAGGWLHTGDLAVMEENSHFHITGRAKEMIIRGGENLFPAEIESYLATHPKVAEAYVIGLPDARLGESVLAWIRLRAGESATEDELRAFCEGKIAHFKVPQYFRFVDAFPMTVTGKVQKFVIRQQEIRERGLEELAKIKTA
jgi:fatty-acyl-CoA synthase